MSPFLRVSLSTLCLLGVGLSILLLTPCPGISQEKEAKIDFVEEIDRRLIRLEVENWDQEKKLEGFAMRIDSLSEALRNVNKEIGSLTTRLKELDGTIQNLRVSRDTIATQIARLASQITPQDADIRLEIEDIKAGLKKIASRAAAQNTKLQFTLTCLNTGIIFVALIAFISLLYRRTIHLKPLNQVQGQGQGQPTPFKLTPFHARSSKPSQAVPVQEREPDDKLVKFMERIEANLDALSKSIEKREAEPSARPPSIHKAVYELRDAGYTQDEIAKKLGIGKGEIEFILKLRKKGFKEKDEGSSHSS